MNIECVATDNADFLQLVGMLDQYFHETFGEVAAAYQKYHSLKTVRCALVAYEDGASVGCGCWRPMDLQTGEVKRMFIRPAYRRRGIAAALLRVLEQNAAQAGCRSLVLETGREMREAIACYQACGYEIIENYGDFAGDTVCVCMRKWLEERQ